MFKNKVNIGCELLTGAVTLSGKNKCSLETNRILYSFSVVASAMELDMNTNDVRSEDDQQKRVSSLMDGYLKYKFDREIPYFDSRSPSVNYLHSLYLKDDCFQTRNQFKQLIAHLSMTIIDHPYNIPLILNLSVSYPMYRNVMFDKFSKLDKLLSVITETPNVISNKQDQSLNSEAFYNKYKNSCYVDIVGHYTQYQIKLKKYNINPSKMYESESDDDISPQLKQQKQQKRQEKQNKESGDIDVKTGGNNGNRNDNNDNRESKENENKNENENGSPAEIANLKQDFRAQYIRSGKILGNNSNYIEFLESVCNHLSKDHSQFLTITAPYVSTLDMDLLCSRFVIICEGLVTCDFGCELMVETQNDYLMQILEYLTKFIQFCIAVNDKVVCIFFFPMSRVSCFVFYSSLHEANILAFLLCILKCLG